MTVPSNKKTSTLVPYQLPAYIREDPSYTNFVLFVQAYYEWLEQSGNVTDGTKNILNYMDVDRTSAQFLQYFTKDFLSFFPASTLANQVEVIKLAKELYQTKGTESSYRLLFRILYNTDVDFFNTGDAVLRASAGSWYVSRSLSLETTDSNFLFTQNLRVFGETTKSIATIEIAENEGLKTEVFISNMERLFQSGEYVRVVDSNNQDVYFLNGQEVSANTLGSYVLRAKIVGQISQIKIDPANRGLEYFTGDPVAVYGGLSSPSGHGAAAAVGDVTSGTVQRVNVVVPAYGFTPSNNPGYPGEANTLIQFSNLNSGAKAPIAIVGGLDTGNTVNTNLIAINWIGLHTGANTYTGTTIGANNYYFSNIAVSNANTTLINAFTFTSFATYPLSSVIVENGGGGITTIPTVTPYSLYNTENGNGNTNIILNQANLGSLGILSPILIVNGGTGYSVNNQIIFTGGSGVGAYANVTAVNGNGTITAVSFEYPPSGPNNLYPVGGFGYQLSLPTLTVSGNGSNAVLMCTGTLGNGAVLSPVTNRVGSITTINITDYGEDYVAAPNVSFRVEDLLVTNVAPNNLASAGDIVYQGPSQANSTFKANVDLIQVLVPNITSNGIYLLRVYNYNATPNVNLPLMIDSKKLSMNLTSSYVPPAMSADPRYSSLTPYMLVYGDGNALGTVTFLNGLTIGQGQYLDTKGQPSSFDVLQSTTYNDYTYEITLEKEIAAYRNTLLNLLHPAGMQVLGRYALKSNNSLDTFMIDSVSTAVLLQDVASINSYAVMSASYANPSNNIIYFNALGAGVNLANIIFANSTIEMISANGDIVYSQVNTVNSISNTVTLTGNVWLSFANVAYANGTVNTKVINITSLTNSYNIINNGHYTNPALPLEDIVKAGEDYVLVANNSSLQVASVDYVHNKIYLSSNLTSNFSSLLSVSRTITANANEVRIYTTPGVPYLSEILTEAGIVIVSEGGLDIIIIE